MISSLEPFRAFYYTAKSGSVTGAAALLSVSQPAVSQAVGQLEKSLGVTLFGRAARGIKLTAEGELLYSYVARGYEQIELGVEKVRQMRNLELGEIHIGASDMTLQFYLLPFLEKFHERYPKIKVVVSNGPTPETLRLLEKGGIDFGVVSSPFEASEKVTSFSVREIEDVFVAGRRFISYKNRMLDLQELEQLPMIVLEGDTSTGNYLNRYLAENGVILRPEFELATSGMIVQFALRNLGIGCVVRDFAQEALESGRLFELRFNKMIPKRSICVVTNRKATLSTAAGRLLEILEI